MIGGKEAKVEVRVAWVVIGRHAHLQRLILADNNIIIDKTLLASLAVVG